MDLVMKDKEKKFNERIECGIAYCEDTAVDEIKQDFKMHEQKNKQIEEMASDLCGSDYAVVIIQGKSTKLSNQTKNYLKRLIDKGWIKSDKDSVVLSRGEWKQIKKFTLL